MKSCIIDIRTTALPEAELLHLMPEFKAPANYKDAEKIAAHIAGQKAEWLDKAAFSALTGRMLAVGSWRDGKTDIMHSEDETSILLDLWAEIVNCIREHRVVVGFDIFRQKIPFAVRRSWALGVPVPDGLFPPNETLFIDLLENWRCGDKHEYITLSTLGKFLGCSIKTAAAPAFASSRAGAVASLTADLLLTEQIMQRMVPGTEACAPAATTSPPAPQSSSRPQPEEMPVGTQGGAETLSLSNDDY